MVPSRENSNIRENVLATEEIKLIKSGRRSTTSSEMAGDPFHQKSVVVER
jgi:hypothetical protein